MKKAFNLFTIIAAAAALALMGWAGCRFYFFYSDYAQVWRDGTTAGEVEQLEAERDEAADQLAAGQKELAQQKSRLTALADAEGTDRGAQIRDWYAAREEAEFAARSLVAEALQKANYITLTSEQQETFGSVLIDEITGNAVLSGGVKAAIQAASEDKALGDILEDAMRGAASGVQDYVQGEIQGKISDIVGLDIFSVADFVSQWKNANDIPVSLVNCMVIAQQQDVCRLARLLEQEELNGTDLRTMAALVERISDRGQEIIAAGGTAGDFGGAEELVRLAQEWERNNWRIIQYAEIGGDIDEEQE